VNWVRYLHINQLSRNELWIRVGHGLLNILHHIGAASSLASEPGAVAREYMEHVGSAVKAGYPPADLIVRAHRHKPIEVRWPRKGCRTGGVVTAGWQLKTPFAWKLAGVRTRATDVGGLVIEWKGDKVNGDLLCHHHVRPVE